MLDALLEIILEMGKVLYQRTKRIYGKWYAYIFTIVILSLLALIAYLIKMLFWN